MSAYTHQPQGPGQVISIGSPNAESDSILGISQQIETALAVGREQIRKLRDDILAMQSRYQQTVLEGERKLHEGQAREQQLGQALTGHQQTAARREKVLTSELASQRERAEALQRDLDNALRQMDQARTETRQKIEAGAQREQQLKAEVSTLRGMQEALKANVAGLQSRVVQLQDAVEKSRGEVDLYKTSWSQVLQMERDARTYLQKKDATETRIRTLESRNQDLLSEAKNRIRDLEAARSALTAQLEQVRNEARTATGALESERRAAAEERANAGCALRAAEEERARSIEAQNEVTAAREQSHVAVTHARAQTQAAEAQARTAEAHASQLRARIEELEQGAAATPPAAPGTEPEIEIQVAELGEDFERISASRTHLETERDALKTQLAQAIREMNEIRQKSDRMKRNYPLRDLLAHKEAELTTAVRELKKISEHAPGRQKAEDIVETLSEQRDQLRGILRDSEMSRT